ncbi:MAG: DNA-binding protein [Desulfuromonadaceae bacterium]|nr:DNA-binding protein [Desulfuromonadaceae bacterium]
MKQVVVILIAVTLICGGASKTFAFWGDVARQSPSGLDVAAGYDVNTVTTIRGTVITPPAKADKNEHTQMTIATGQGVATVLLGPWSYWERQGFTVNRDQEISITGSRAQGKDGSTYLFAQKLENITAGSSLSLRSDSGVPNWSRGRGGGGGGGGQNINRGTGGGAGYRGGAMRGGGR